MRYFNNTFLDCLERASETELEVDFTSNIDGMLRLSVGDVDFCEMLITAENIRDTMTSCT